MSGKRKVGQLARYLNYVAIFFHRVNFFIFSNLHPPPLSRPTYNVQNSNSSTMMHMCTHHTRKFTARWSMVFAVLPNTAKISSTAPHQHFLLVLKCCTLSCQHTQRLPQRLLPFTFYGECCGCFGHPIFQRRSFGKAVAPRQRRLQHQQAEE